MVEYKTNHQVVTEKQKRACSLGLHETPACIHVIQRLSQPRVACWHGFRKNFQKTECVFKRCPTGSRKKKLRVYNGLRSEGVLRVSHCSPTAVNKAVSVEGLRCLAEDALLESVIHCLYLDGEDFSRLPVHNSCWYQGVYTFSDDPVTTSYWIIILKLEMWRWCL